MAKERANVTLSGLSARVDGLDASVDKLAASVGRLETTIDKLAAMVAEGFEFMRNELRTEICEEIDKLSGRIDHLETSMNAKFLAVHNRLDDIALNRATRDELAHTNGRVTRIEGHLGLA